MGHWITVDGNHVFIGDEGGGGGGGSVKSRLSNVRNRPLDTSSPAFYKAYRQHQEKFFGMNSVGSFGLGKTGERRRTAAEKKSWNFIAKKFGKRK
jgi:hypothetical protein